VAVADEAGDQVVARRTRDGVFAGGVDLGDAHHVGVVEAGAEIVEQACSRV
jgi:hypothetical protein